MNLIFQKIRNHQLPLYLIIGFPKVGKTTFIAHNVNQFQVKALLDNIKLFTSKEGDFLEISLIPQQIAIDIPKCINIIKRYRAIQGIFLVTEAVALVERYQANNQAYEIDVFNQWLSALSKRLKTDCPVHIIFSQLDKIAGFQPFFEYLLTAQVSYRLGFDLAPAKQANLLSAIEKGFSKLKQNLQTKMIERLYQTDHLEKRRCIQQFPHQIQYLQLALVMWIQSFEVLYAKSLWYVKSCYASGYVYPSMFSETLIYNPVKLDLIKKYALNSTKTTHHLSVPLTREMMESTLHTSIYFLGAQYFKHIDQIHQVSPARRKRIYFIWPIAILCLFISIGGSFYYYQSNVNALTTVKHALLEEQSLNSAGNPVNRTLKESLAHFNQLQHALMQLQSPRIFPIQKRILETALQKAYTRALRRDLWPHLQGLLESAMQTNPQSSEASYKILKTWLMLKEPQKANTIFLIKQLTQLAQASLEDAYLKNSVQRDVEYLIKNIFSRELKSSINFSQFDQAVHTIRSRLLQLPAGQLVLFALNSMFEEKPTLYPFQNQLGIAEQSLFKDLPEHLAFTPQYTVNYFSSIYAHIIPQLTQDFIAGKDWVLTEDSLSSKAKQSDIELRRIIETVRIDWLSAYAATWQAKCKQLRLREINNWAQLKQVFVNLQTRRVPFEALIATIFQHTHLECLQKTLSHWKLQDHLLIDRYLSDHFQSLDSLNNNLVLMLKKLQYYLAPVFHHTDSDKSAFHLLRQCFLTNTSDDPLSGLFDKTDSLPAPIAQWMNIIAVQIRKQLFESTQRYLNRVWHDQVFIYYKAKLDSRYPLFKNSEHDICLVDFVHFFGPQGRVATYLQEYLAPFIDRTQARWQLRHYQGQSIPIATEAMSQLERAYVIQQLFSKVFLHSRIPFKIKTVNLAPRLKVSVEYGGSLYSLTESVGMGTLLRWPLYNQKANDADNDVKIMVYTSEGLYSTQVFRGVWAWFHLVDALKKENYKVPIMLTMRAKGYTISYELSLAEEDNIFISGILQYFRCPIYLTE